MVAPGERHGRWTVLRLTIGAQKLAPCRCDCGTKRSVRVSHLVYGNTRSCGCLIGDTARTHGKSGTPEHRAWERMIARCYNQQHKAFKDYGARGITVAAVWRGPKGFARFLAHVGQRPTPQHSLDRYPNTNGAYKPGNVRWATRIEQNQNTRRTVRLTLDGKTQCVSAWARELGFNKKTISERLRRGWSARKALTTPTQPERAIEREIARSATRGEG